MRSVGGNSVNVVGECKSADGSQPDLRDLDL